MADVDNRHGPLDLVRLRPLMTRTTGRPEVGIGLVDGPVLLDHPDLAGARVSQVEGGREPGGCRVKASSACVHGTFIAGILVAARGSSAPGICPDCTLVSRPIFSEEDAESGASATPDQLASAMVACVEAGAIILNVSAALLRPDARDSRRLAEALDHVVRQGVLVVAAAGNEGMIDSSSLTRHPGVIPVVGCGTSGRPFAHSNLSGSVAKRGLRAPAEAITSLGTDGAPFTASGTSAAAAFVSGALALLMSLFPATTSNDLRMAATGAARRRPTLVPPMLDAEAAYGAIQARLAPPTPWR